MNQRAPVFLHVRELGFIFNLYDRQILSSFEVYFKYALTFTLPRMQNPIQEIEELCSG